MRMKLATVGSTGFLVLFDHAAVTAKQRRQISLNSEVF